MMTLHIYRDKPFHITLHLVSRGCLQAATCERSSDHPYACLVST